MKWVVCDANYLCWRNYYTGMRDFTHEDVPTGVIFGMLRDIVTLQNEFNTENIAFCFDHRKSNRKKIYDGYKHSREAKRTQMSTEENQTYRAMITQIELLIHDVLPKLGFNNVFQQSGYEADDLIASFCQHNEEEIIIVSADHDLYQLLSCRVSMWNPIQRVLFGLEDFEGAWGLSPPQWAYVKAIAGCQSDDIPGVPKVGEKTAAKFVAGTMTKKGKVYDSIIAAQKQIRRNLKLVKLPFKGTMVCEATPNTLNQKKWGKMIKKFGITSIAKTAPRFKD